MVIDTLQEVINGMKQNVAPVTIFEAIKADAESNLTLANVLKAMQGETNTFTTTKSGYAIVGEWKDGNPANEDRTGKFVTFDAGKIKVATPSDTIYGVVTKNAGYIENYEDISEDHTKAVICIYGMVSVLCKDTYTSTDLNNNVRITVSDAGNGKKSSDNTGYIVCGLGNDSFINIYITQNGSTISNIDSYLVDINKKLDDILARLPEVISLSVEGGDFMVDYEDSSEEV